MTMDFNSKLDLTFERIVDVPPTLSGAWTEPELIKKWFCPLPWRTIEAEVDVRPGGIFRTTMRYRPKARHFPTSAATSGNSQKRRRWTNPPVARFPVPH